MKVRMRRLGFASILFAVLCLSASALSSSLSAQTITGLVFERGSGAPIQGASISVLDSDFQGLIQNLYADALGRFRVILPDSGVYLVTASHSEYVAPGPEVLVLGPADSVTIMLALQPLRPDTVTVAARALEDGSYTADVFGRVVDNNGGQPVANAEVRLIGLEGMTTGSNGRFFIKDLPPGPARVYVQHLSFQPRETHIDLEPGVAYEVLFRLDPDPVEIPGVEVTAVARRVARRLEPVYERMERAVTAHFRTKEEFESRGHPPVGAMIRGMPRVRVAQRGMMWNVRMMGAATLSGQGCTPVIYLDGIKVTNPEDPTSVSEFMAMSTFDVAVIEVYAGASSLPPEFNDPGTMCAIGIWTRRGGG
jgi:hypothetical protein